MAGFPEDRPGGCEGRGAGVPVPAAAVRHPADSSADDTRYGRPRTRAGRGPRQGRGVGRAGTPPGAAG